MDETGPRYKMDTQTRSCVCGRLTICLDTVVLPPSHKPRLQRALDEWRACFVQSMLATGCRADRRRWSTPTCLIYTRPPDSTFSFVPFPSRLLVTALIIPPSVLSGVLPTSLAVYGYICTHFISVLTSAVVTKCKNFVISDKPNHFYD